MNDDLDDEILPSDEGFDEFSKKPGLASSVRSSPAAKIGIVLVAVAIVVGIIMMFGGDETPMQPSSLPQGSDVSSAPGTEKATPAYVAAVEQQNEATLETALKTGDSAIPVPVDSNQKDRLQVPEQEEKKEDPLQRWRQMQEQRTERDLKEEDAVQAVTVLDSQQQSEEVKNLATSMSDQMQSILSKNVEDIKFQYVGLIKKKETSGQGAQGGTAGQPPQGGNNGGASNNFSEEDEKVLLIPTGEIEYAQTLIESNSDIKGPVLAQLLTGPLKGARLMGTFSVEEDKYLVLTFNTAVVDGKDYQIDAIALDPDTTLAGVVSDVDNRYFQRIVLPAASAFISGFASAVAETGRTDVIVSGSGTATSQTNTANDQQRVATGVQEAGDAISGIIDDMADVKPLVTLKAGTPVGVLFQKAVYEKESDI